MALDIFITVAAVGLCVALLSGYAAGAVVSAVSPERRRLRQLAGAGHADVLTGGLELVDTISPHARHLPGVPKSAKEMGRLRRRLATAGFSTPQAVIVYGVATLAGSILMAGLAVAAVGTGKGLILALAAAAIGYMLPGVVLEKLIKKRKKEIRNGLPDALDLFIVCVEAGCALDQAIVKASDELALPYPALASELRLITTEIRAGKPRLDAFKNFAIRTKVDDVQSLVALMVQTDRFGTSIAQALRTHAETSRLKRRQNAEERAAKLGVKLVFPLVLFLFPALYVVILGPAAITFVRVLQPIAR